MYIYLGIELCNYLTQHSQNAIQWTRHLHGLFQQSMKYLNISHIIKTHSCYKSNTYSQSIYYCIVAVFDIFTCRTIELLFNLLCQSVGCGLCRYYELFSSNCLFSATLYIQSLYKEIKSFKKCKNISQTLIDIYIIYQRVSSYLFFILNVLYNRLQIVANSIIQDQQTVQVQYAGNRYSSRTNSVISHSIFSDKVT